ncbi:MAG: MBL fold metallo-hydrolase [Fibrobacter sp.]|jgi:L-ascorbate metabolism protein UlaG (beta-lactamase superfamily)|nr:MBL fold metallo-hydrolase [Fibrobacter sp.]HON10688.1 MBL fold metallo-hydrolase [Chitinispirillaceae bacterium]
MRHVFAPLLVIFALSTFSHAQKQYQTDTISTSSGNLMITFLGHGSLMFTFDSTVVHVDPYSKVADYSTLPDADLVLITHHHQDHLDTAALNQILKQGTVIVGTQTVAGSLKDAVVMKNGDSKKIKGIEIKAVPAYNIVHKRDNGQPFHPKGEGNGYIVTIKGKKIYIAGDTENIPEMKQFKRIDIAFLPVNLPYTMTPEMAADAARAVKPKIFYPYHFGDTEISRLTELLKNDKDIEVRIRDMQ